MPTNTPIDPVLSEAGGDASPVASGSSPRLTEGELELVASLGERERVEPGAALFSPGDTDLDFFVVESGLVRITNITGSAAPARDVARHGPREFVGDIDLLTRRASAVGAIAGDGGAVVIRVPGRDLRRLLVEVPRLSEKLLAAFQLRREELERAKIVGVRVIGPASSAPTNAAREFLHRNFVPLTWFDAEAPAGVAELERVGVTPSDDAAWPVVIAMGDQVLRAPSHAELARVLGLRRALPTRTFDLVIVGAGPAGLTAAVYAASEGLSVIVLDAVGPGGQAAGSSLIENFIGFPGGLSGRELGERGLLQLMKFGGSLLVPFDVDHVELGDEHHRVVSTGGEVVSGMCVLAATGVRWRRLEVPGAARFERAGVFYAATSVETRHCAGNAGVVVGGGNSAGQAAMFLAECASKVTLIIRGESLDKGMSAYLASRVRACEKIEVLENTEVLGVLGEEQVTGVLVKTGTRDSRKIACGAVYVFIGSDPSARWLPPDIGRDEQGSILAGAAAGAHPAWTQKRAPCPLETTIPRLLVAGDLRAGSTKRVGFAVGDGAMAVTCVHHLLR
jgi:thioredoxin reductase (NADPH)